MFQLIATAATALGVFLGWWQLRAAKRQAVVAFEDTLAREYRDIVHQLPVGALLGEKLSEAEHVRH